MRPGRSHVAKRPLRLLALMSGGAAVLFLAFLSSAATFQPDYSAFPQRALVARDTDSVAVAIDSAAIAARIADSLWADTSRAKNYLPLGRIDMRGARLRPRTARPFTPPLGRYWQHEVRLDSTERLYITRETVGERDVRDPQQMDFDTYRRARLKASIYEEFERLSEQSTRRQQLDRRQGGLGFNIVVPGGRESAFSTIFGTTDIDLRVNGQANINAGFNIRKDDQQAILTGRERQVDPEFRQDLRLGIVGTIGDKMRIDVNWDTQRDFDFQNQLKLQYTGYDDDIIKNIEAGNVFLQTNSSLIRGGQSLFGIKSEFQVGGVQFQTVVSQQEGQANSLQIDGGSQETLIDLRPTGYDQKSHFFLSYYFRNRWEDALSDRPTILVADEFERITDIELWRLVPTDPTSLTNREAIAVVDLGEEQAILSEANEYSNRLLPKSDLDQYLDESEINTDNLVAAGLDETDFQTGQFKKLEPGRDYDFNEVLGYVSLRSSLQESEALCVAFRYIAGGRVFQVGQFASEVLNTSGDLLVLKLLRPTNLRQPNIEEGFNPAAWYLEMRNIYRLNTRGVNPDDFELQILYEPPGQPSQKTLPGVAGSQTLLQMLGFDKLNQDFAERPDDRFDYLNNITIDPANGYLIFPYLEPFGGRIEQLIDETVDDPAAQEEAKSKFVYRSLYQQKQLNAIRDSQLDVYSITGAYKGSVQSFYNLNSFSGVVEGSVRVTSGGTPLTEDADYTVDYQGGTVSITNPAFLTPGRNIEIDYEQNQFFSIQKKTLLGARAYYELENKLTIGTTLMRLSQKSPVDKFRLGEEPIANTIWGVDGNLNLEPRWLTRAIDFLPLIQTREQSTLKFTGEFAQLRPGHTETTAFRRTREDLERNGRDFKSDELRGISYIDDFEGFETTFSLKQPGGWLLSAPPLNLRGMAEPDSTVMLRSEQNLHRSFWRGNLAWYTLNVNTVRELDGKATFNEAIDIVEINDVFPDRDTQGEVDRTLSTLDLYFDPEDRGPYNYNTELGEMISNPKDVWGGITQRLPDGFNDFNLKNIEFVEFIIRPFAHEAADIDPDAKLYLNLGSISEDILPNGNLNNEDGLSTSGIGAPPDFWGRLPTVTPDNVISIQGNITEDLGLDGLSSYDITSYEPAATEQIHFEEYLANLDRSIATPEYQAMIARIEADPSGDDYHYFNNDQYYENPTFFPNGTTVQQRFSKYFSSSELNSFEGQNKLANNTNVKRGNSRFPDSEDLNRNSAVDVGNDYFQYEIPLNKAELDRLGHPNEIDDYVVGEIVSEDNFRTGWYQIRIPVQKPDTTIGNIQDFSLIESLRLWTTGHSNPMTLRMASFELVGSQWRKTEQLSEEQIDGQDQVLSPDTRLTISSINNEENSDTYRTPFGTVISQTRLATGGTQEAREQSLVLRVENLLPGSQQAVFKTYSTPLDLLRYSNLRMFAHMHGTASGQDLTTLPPEEARDPVRLFIRLGSNETNDFYEYEQPLTPSDFPSPGIDVGSDIIWQTNQLFNGEVQDLNSINMLLGAFNRLKVARDEFVWADDIPVATDTIFWNVLDGMLRGPNAEDFAPPGTRLGIKGNPSLAKINTIVMGIRNPHPEDNEMGRTLDDVTIWLNELRATGYDEKNGWAAIANLDMKLADLGRFKASIRRQTDGFGSLESTLGERDQNDQFNWSLIGDINLDKFLSERSGWQIPVSGQIKSSTSTPRFAPSRGDVRLEEIEQQIQETPNLTQAQKTERIREAREAAQSHDYQRSYSVRVGKSGSQSGIGRVLLDGISVNYSYSDSEARNPSQRVRSSWQWNTNLSYRLSIRQPKTLRPFWFLEEVPVMKMLGDLRFNYLPQQLSASATASRRFSAQQDRSELELTPLEEISQFPLREQHTFSHRRNVSFDYNPFSFLSLSFDTNTNQSLNQLGVDTLYSVIDTRSNVEYQNLRLDQALADTLQYGIFPGDVGETAFQREQLQLISARQAFSGLLSNNPDLRTETHDQQFSATFQPNFTRIEALNWLTIQPVSYSVNYRWQNAAAGRLTGANVSNNASIRSGMTLRPIDLWRKIPFYEKLEEQQRAVETENQNKQREREQARADKREVRREAREAERERRIQELQEEQRRRQEAEEREALGLPPLEEVEPEEEAADSTQTEAEPLPEVEVDELDDRLAQEEEMRRRQALEQLPPGAQPQPGEEEVVPADTLAEEKRGLPKLNILGLLRRGVLAVTGVRDLSITYNGSQNGASSNVGIPIRGSDGQINDVSVHYSLYDALFKKKGPPTAYRFGRSRQIDLANRIVTSNLQVTDVLSSNNRLAAQTSLNPTSNISVSLNWSTNWGTNDNFTYRALDANMIETSGTQTGTTESSVWSYKADYLAFFDRQLVTYIDDAANASDPGVGLPRPNLGDENGDGRVFMTNATLSEDFIDNFLHGAGTIDTRGLLPFPMPGWQVNFTGLSRWPVFELFTKGVTLKHGYNSLFSTTYSTNAFFGTADSTRTLTIGETGNERIIEYNVPEIEVGTVNITEQFTPLLGLNMTLKGDINADFNWNKRNQYSLSTTIQEVGEVKRNELSFTLGFQKTRLKLPFFKKTLNNRVSINLTFKREVLTEQRLRFGAAIAEAVSVVDGGGGYELERALRGDNISVSKSFVKITIIPKISYQFNNRVAGEFNLNYIRQNSDVSRDPTFTEINGTFNIRVSIQN